MYMFMYMFMYMYMYMYRGTQAGGDARVRSARCASTRWGCDHTPPHLCDRPPPRLLSMLLCALWRAAGTPPTASLWRVRGAARLSA